MMTPGFEQSQSQVWWSVSYHRNSILAYLAGRRMRTPPPSTSAHPHSCLLLIRASAADSERRTRGKGCLTLTRNIWVTVGRHHGQRSLSTSWHVRHLWCRGDQTSGQEASISHRKILLEGTLVNGTDKHVWIHFADLRSLTWTTLAL